MVMREPVTIDVREMQTAFTKVTRYLSSLPKDRSDKDEDFTIQGGLDKGAALWEKHFGVKVHAVWGEDTMTFTFKDKETFTLFMLEWS